MPLVTLTVRRGKDGAFKSAVLDGVHDALRQSPGLDPDDVMLVFKETTWENWSFGGGRFIHA